MVYFVTFCTFDTRIGSNPAWHGSFFLSKENEETKQIEVIETWGFYGVPSTGDPNHWFRRLKKSVGLDIDLVGNHGWLEHEEVRYMDVGYGLHGHSYELTQDQFEQLQQKCRQQVFDQKAAVSDALAQVDPNKIQNDHRIKRYRGEQFSSEIYQIEQNRAKKEGRESRLKPFGIQITYNSNHILPSIQEHLCKSEALDILETVLSPKQLAPYRQSSIPRWVSGKLEPIILYSEGSLSEFNSSQKKVYYRDMQTPGVKLIWTLPPQKFEELPNSGTKLYLSVDEEYCEEAKNVISRLQRLDWLLRHAEVDKPYKVYQERLIKRVVDCYQAFSILETQTNKTPKISGFLGSVYSFFNVPKNKEQKNLLDKISAAKDLFNSLYMAIVDGWGIFDKSQIRENEGEDENAPEAVAAYFSPDVQKNLCHIIGRTYSAPEYYSEDEEREASNKMIV
jgi:hypothetical protein